MRREFQQGRPLGVYVHFPWCVSKCPYCDFFSVETRSDIPHEAYANAVIRELETRCEAVELSTLRSVYFGGGTPSLWDVTQVQRVVARILSVFGARDNSVEITIECNPSSFDRRKCQLWQQAGINRLSLGVQSLDESSLRFLGRAHDVRAALDAVRTALDSGIDEVGVDLIFGLPGRSAADSVRELDQLPIAELSHVSAYALTIEPNTQFGALARKGKLELAPDEAVTEAFFAVHDALVRSGFEHYEISNFARPRCRSKHNTGYWQGRDYLGLGVAAWGTVQLLERESRKEDSDHHVRYRNTTRIDRYLELAMKQPDSLFWSLQPGGILAEREVIDENVALAERVMLGLRTSEGIDIASLANEFDVDAWLVSRRKTLDKLQGRGRVAFEGSRLWIPFQMWYLADGTISELI